MEKWKWLEVCHGSHRRRLGKCYLRALGEAVPSGQEENGSSNVWVMSKKLCRALSCSVPDYSSADVLKDGLVSPCSVTMGSTAELPPALPS